MSIKNEPYLTSMLNKNLYSPSNIYNIDKSKIVNIIDNVTKYLTNDTYSIQNTLMDRTLSQSTKLTSVASIQLSKMLLERINYNLRKNYIPTVDVKYSGINILKPLSYWKITKTNDVDSVSKLLEIIKGFSNPLQEIATLESFGFDYTKHNAYLISMLGDGQKEMLFSMVSKNKFNVFSEDTYGKDTVSYYKGENEDSIKYKYDKLISESNLSNGYSYEVGNLGARINPKTKAFSFMKQDGSTKLVPKGSNITKTDNSDEFIRIFTVDNQYDSYDKAMKYEHGRLGENSVLQKVVPRIFPKSSDDYKNLMFSITNLAQNNNKIMWFPPYNITLNESVSVGFDKKDFLGRNEPIYTYSGTERKCTLGFTLISDYPSELNNLKKWGDKSNNEFSKFFVTDYDLSDNIKDNSEEVAIVNKENQPPQKEVITPLGTNNYPSSNSLKYYFDNNNYTLKSADSLTNDDQYLTGKKGITKYMANINLLADFLNSESGKYYKVTLDGYSSSAYNENYNDVLSYKRAYAVYKDIFNRMNDKSNPLPEYTGGFDAPMTTDMKYFSNPKFRLNPHGEREADTTNLNINTAIKDRFVALYLTLDSKKIVVDVEQFSDDNKKNVDKQDNKSDISSYEKYYFQDTPKTFVNGKTFDYNNVEKSLIKGYSESIKYFSPVFHSQTPENMNERLNFLHQCTRQGNTYLKGSDSNSSINASDNIGNSIFGKPPVCILRLGDFFNTKILIESIDISYEPLMWDVNPEGLGMQPMLANVTMSCIIIGGSSLSGPVNELQNALGNRFYANTEYYD